MNFEELLKLLGAQANATELTAAATAFNESWKAEMSKKNAENKTLRERAKTAEADSKAKGERLEDIYDGLGWDEETDIAEATAAVKKGQNVNPDMQKRLERMQRNHAEEKKALTDQLATLQGEKTDRTKRDALRAELAGANAANPDAILDLFLGKVEVGEDGSVSFSDGKALKDGVAAWFAENAWAVKNSQTPGAGSNGNQNAGGGQGGDKNTSFGAQLAKQVNAGVPGAAAENPYFK